MFAHDVPFVSECPRSSGTFVQARRVAIPAGEAVDLDERTAPWRVLEAPAGASGDSISGRTDHDRRLVAGLGLILAGGLAAAAFVLAASAPSGQVTVSGTAAGPPAGPPAASGHAVTSSAPLAGVPLVVEVEGAVTRPGVYRLPPGSRVGDALAAAGGYGPRVHVERAASELNLAAPVADGDRVRVPSRDDAPPGGSPAPIEAPDAAEPGGGIVHLATATSTELEALPGIGPVTAARIIAAREEQAFSSVDDLRTRKVVGAATFEKIRNLVAVP